MKVSLVLDDRVAVNENQLVLVEGNVDLVRHDLGVANSRINYMVARHAEDSDSVTNERFTPYNSLLCHSFLILLIILFLTKSDRSCYLASDFILWTYLVNLVYSLSLLIV